ncbi:hypothetical protein CQW23_10734 [Capsicum baccatum]|uniref:Uncharacterized protein n=1 Tax=Capsicum baccatum TaxID=33114 RepID=A0A2G2X0G5_CAPBA|nr:hypothetical protein CQW23_10734 [Capsicum baccatum]
MSSFTFDVKTIVGALDIFFLSGLNDVDHCYCVLLNAHDGAAFPSERISSDCHRSDTSSSKSSTNSGKITSKITLFSGFVSYKMVRDGYDDQNVQCKNIVKLVCYEEVDGELFWKIWKASLTSCSFPQTDRIYMRGPGGQGEVEVAISGVVGERYSISTFCLRKESLVEMQGKAAYNRPLWSGSSPIPCLAGTLVHRAAALLAPSIGRPVNYLSCFQFRKVLHLTCKTAHRRQCLGGVYNLFS